MHILRCYVCSICPYFKLLRGQLIHPHDVQSQNMIIQVGFSTTKIMQAITYDHYGDASVLTFETAVTKPQITSDDQVLIKISYAGVNFIDTYFRSGLYPVASFPKILGQDGT